MKKGFTLIELLSVIVILAVILIIAVPKIMNTIYNSKISSMENSTKLLASNIEKKYEISLTNGEENTLSLTGDCMNLLNIDKDEYASCTYTIENGKATVKLVGNKNGKFAGISCLGSKNDTECNKTHTVYFNLNGGNSIISSKLVNRYFAYGELPIPTKEDYKFIGWYNSDNELITEDTIFLLDSDEVLNAEYTKIINTFDFTESEVVYDVKISGNYKIEVWGASGGMPLAQGHIYETNSGYGAYAIGTIKLNKGDKLYINVGGAGEDGKLKVDSIGGYNGGGNGSWDGGDDETSGAGGGATSVSLVSGLLSTLENNKNDIIIVAAGGGGSSWYYSAGSGGGINGGITTTTKQEYPTQISGYSFGVGENGIGAADSDGVGGGGGGFYGGYSNNVSYKSAGTGGSSYIGNTRLFNKVMYCYNCTESDDVDTKTINTTCNSSTPTSNCAKDGSGYAIITILD